MVVGEPLANVGSTRWARCCEWLRGVIVLVSPKGSTETTKLPMAVDPQLVLQDALSGWRLSDELLGPLLLNSRYYFQPRAGADRREF